jgi:N-carbamoyl-L-amino-acid hydrolase
MSDRPRAVLIGSHTDTVPNGGWLDGSLGVIYGLEVARSLKESGRLGNVGVDVVSFMDEEGTYLAEYGCRIFCGEDVTAEAADARNQAGESLTAAVAASGVLSNPPACLDRQRHVAYLEAHIEQGPRLEAERLQIGVVTGIVGIRTYRIVLHGRADHAGTTPMTMRSDAGSAALKFGAALTEEFRKIAAPDSVWNVGNAVFKPGVANVVPSEVRIAMQFRDASADVLDRLEAAAERILAEAATAFGATFEMTCILRIAPTPMDAGLGVVIENAARAVGAPYVRMPSGAGHDAMIMARHLRTAMFFVPSIGGRSHHVSENTSDTDIVTGANVMLASAAAVCAGK